MADIERLERKPQKRKTTKRRPIGYDGLWADTKYLPIDLWRVWHLTAGWKLERIGALIKFVHTVWSSQEHLPDDISGWSNPQLRRRFLLDPRYVRRFLDDEMRRAVAEIVAKRAPLCDGIREEIFAKADGKCHHCGVSIDPDNFHVDHLIPVARGGLTHESNLVASCPQCNFKKGARLQ